MLSIRDHSGHSEPSRIDCGLLRVLIILIILIRRRRLLEKIVDQFFKGRIVPRLEAALEDCTKDKPFLPKQTEIAFCAANVSDENHRRLIDLHTIHLDRRR